MRKWLKALWNVITFPFRIIARFFRFILRSIKKFFGKFSGIGEFFTEEPEDSPIGDTFAKVTEQPVGLFEHIDALRRHLLRSVLALIVTTSLAFAVTPKLIDWLAEPIGGITNLIAIEVTEPISVYMRVALLTGFTLALPYIAFEFYLFVAPGLQPKSRVAGLFALPAVLIFFVSGAAFAYFVMLPVGLPFLLNFMGIQTNVRPESYIKFVTGVMFWIGLFFEFPLVVYVLARLGWVNWKFLLGQWRIAIVLIAVIAAAVTPTIDPVNMSLVMGPMIVLYFLGILMAYFAQRGRQ